MIAALLPRYVISAELPPDTQPAQLYPEELSGLADAVHVRRREFALGRQCARAALVGLGYPPAIIPIGESGAPVWPRGCFGSITHCRGFVGAAVGRAEDVSGVGIDAEPAEALEPRVASAVCTGEERLWVLDQAARSTPWTKVLFSAKEAIYKCVYPRTRMRLDFLDVTVRIQSDGTFAATSSRVDLSRLRGHWLRSDTLVLTTAVEPS